MENEDSPRSVQTKHKDYNIYHYTNNMLLIVTITFMIIIFTCSGELLVSYKFKELNLVLV